MSRICHQQIRFIHLIHDLLRRLSHSKNLFSFFASGLNKIEKQALNIWITKFNTERVNWFPGTVQIEPSSMCNLRCKSCSYSLETTNKFNLTAEQVEQLLKRLSFPIKSIILSGIGEPLINPDLFAIIDQLAARKIKCTIYTNGTLLTPQKADMILSRNNIISLAISCDSSIKNIFEELRTGADFEEWEYNVRSFMTKSKNMQSNHIKITMFTVISEYNVKEADQILRYAASLGFRNINYFDPVPIPNNNNFGGYFSAISSGFDKDHILQLGKELGIKVILSFRRNMIPPKAKIRCYQPWEYIMIKTNGDVYPCRALFKTDESRVIGNIYHEDFSDIWHGEKVQLFRKTSANGTNEYCRICPYY